MGPTRVAAISDEQRLDVLTPLVAEHRRDLAHCGVGFDRVEDERQEVRAAPRGLPQLLERRAVRTGIAPRPERPQALDLLALPPWIDRGHRHRGAVLFEGVHADDDAFPALHLELVLVGRSLDLALRVTLLDGR